MSLKQFARFNELDNLRKELDAHPELVAEANKNEDQLNGPLHMGAANGHLQVCELLVKRGFLLVANDFGNTPLSYAILNQHVEVVKLLLTMPDVDVLKIYPGATKVGVLIVCLGYLHSHSHFSLPILSLHIYTYTPTLFNLHHSVCYVLEL